MRDGGALAEGVFVDVVERGEPAREELAIDHPLGKSVGGAEAELPGELIDPLPDQPLVARSERREPVADDDPVGQPAIDQAALAARLADHFGIVADPDHFEGGRIDRAEHVEIDETVVERGDQRIGHRMGEPHQIGIVARRIDDDEIVAVLDRAHRFGEGGKFLRLDFVEAEPKTARDAIMNGHFELDAGALGPVAAVLDVMGEAFLPRVEVDGGDALAGLQQRDGDVHRRGRFSRAAFFVTKHDDVRRKRLSDVSLHQHDNATPSETTL